VKNFEKSAKTLEINLGEQSREATFRGESVETVTFNSRPGRNTVELPEDSFSEDNTGYFYIPENRSVDVSFISDQKNQYLMKAFELIDFASISYHQPPLERSPNADLYIIGKTDRILSQTVRDIESDVRSGSNLVVFGNQNLADLGFEKFPVKDLGTSSNQTVTIDKPVQISLGEMNIRDIEITAGERYSRNNNAVIRSEYGSGEFLLYNIADTEFRSNFMYPVFWKEITAGMTEKPSIEESNRRTGVEIDRESIESPDGGEISGRTKLKQVGFYETSDGTVAANMLNEDESLRDNTNIQNSYRPSDTSNLSLQKYLVIFILLLVIIETAYLYRIGDLQ
jgi:hypothetical protein